MTGVGWLDLLIKVSGAVAAATVVITAAAVLHKRLWKPIRDFFADWNGTEAREGVPARPGVMAQLQCLDSRVTTIEAEFSNNHGSSMRDAIDRVEQQQAEILQKLDDAA